MERHASRGDEASHRVWQPGLAIAALGVLWLATRPYAGVIHDAKFYAIQAITWLDPAVFAEDLFFAFGSQDRFTLFSPLYAPLIAWLGLPVAHALVLATGHLVWLGSAWLLASALLPDMRIRLWALAALVLLPNRFGGLAALSYGENFVTPRLFVEAATLAALGLALRGRLVAASALIMVGAVLHPLMALPGLGMLMLLRLLAYPRWTVAVLGCGVLALCLAALLPNAMPLRRLDQEWMDVVAARSPMVLVTEWWWPDFVRLAGQTAQAMFVVAALDGLLRRIAIAAFAIGLAGVLTTLLAGDGAHLHIVLAGQPWRSLWLTTVTMNLLLVPAIQNLRRGGFGNAPYAWASVWTAAGGMVLSLALPGLLLAWAPMFVLALMHVVIHRRGIALRRLALLGMKGAWCLVLFWTTLLVLLAVRAVSEGSAESPWLLPRRVGLAAGGLGLLALATLEWGQGRRTRLTSRILAGLLAAVALGFVDQRTQWQRFLEMRGAEHAELERFVPRSARVFWDGGVDILWFRLQRPAFFSCLQGAGVVFFRDTAMAFRERAESFPFQMYEGRCFDSLAPRSVPAIAADLERACRLEPSLDYLIVASRIEGMPASSWYIPVLREIPDVDRLRQPAGAVFRYDCAVLRGASD
jgi:hypothetical protein